VACDSLFARGLLFGLCAATNTSFIEGVAIRHKASYSDDVTGLMATFELHGGLSGLVPPETISVCQGRPHSQAHDHPWTPESWQGQVVLNYRTTRSHAPFGRTSPCMPVAC
jgi:hypothetical protein